MPQRHAAHHIVPMWMQHDHVGRRWVTVETSDLQELVQYTGLELEVCHRCYRNWSAERLRMTVHIAASMPRWVQFKTADTRNCTINIRTTQLGNLATLTTHLLDTFLSQRTADSTTMFPIRYAHTGEARTKSWFIRQFGCMAWQEWHRAGHRTIQVDLLVQGITQCGMLDKLV